jgi:hypothetical protein
MIQILTDIIAAMTGSPTFIYGTEGWNNFKADSAAVFPVIFLNEPLMSNDKLAKSGYMEEVYPLKMMFLDKAQIDWTPAQHHTIIDAMRLLRREFINRLQDDDNIREIDNIQTTDVFNVLDMNLSGVLLEIEISLYNSLSNCYG